MDVVLRTLMTWLWTWPLLATWDTIHLLIDEVSQSWKEEYRHTICGRYMAMEKNLEEGRIFLETRYPDPYWITAWVDAEVQGLQPWAGVPEQFNCEDGRGYRLHRQLNPHIPSDYPNWWIRWAWPGSLEEEA